MTSTSWCTRFLEPYRRVTSSGHYLAEVDGLRFVAIFAVYIYHLAGDILQHSTPSYVASNKSSYVLAVTQQLNVGVPIFFAISGFILGMPFAAERLQNRTRVDLKKYFWRRLTRLEPPYVIGLLLLFVLKLAAGRDTLTDLIPHLFASLLYVHNPIYGEPSAINFVAWSLEIEVQFYILAPLIALVFSMQSAILRRALFTTLILAGCAVDAALTQESVWRLSLAANAQYFLIGFLLADLHLSFGQSDVRNASWDLLSIASVVALIALLNHGGPLRAWVAPWLILVLCRGAFRAELTNRFLRNAWIATIGGMCYTIYLLHNYAVAAVGAFTERLAADLPFSARLCVQFLLITPVVLVISAVYYRLIEKPCMQIDWPRRLVDRVRTWALRIPATSTADE